MATTPTPTPEELQYILGIHPEQQAAAAAMQQPQPQDDGTAPPDQGQPRPISADAPPEQPKAEETPAPAPMISAPPAAGPRPLTAPITIEPRESVIPREKPEMGPPVPPEMEAPPAISGPAAPPSSDLFSTPIRPISADQKNMQDLQGREAKDRAELHRLQDTGSGVEQFQHRHHVLGPIVRGLSIAGTALAPSVAAQIPGTDIHHNVLLKQASGRVESDLGDEAKHQAITSKEDADTAREQGLGIREEAEKAREAQNKVMDDLKQQAQDSKDNLRDISYDKASGQFMRGGQPYTPKDFQEGAILETQHGVANGPYTQKWMAEAKNRQPVTHVPSAESERQAEWHKAFVQEYGREPNAEEWQTEKFNPNTGKKDYTSQRTGAEKTKEAELDRLEKDFNRDWSRAQDDQERDRLTKGLEANKKRVQGAYEAELAQIPGEQQPPASSQPSAGAPQAAKPATPYTHYAVGAGNHRIGYNATTKRWEDVQSGQPVK